jgi:hypothetical protein
MSEPITQNSALNIIAGLLHFEENPHSSYGTRPFEDRLMEYERKTNVYVYIDNNDLDFLKDWLCNDEDAPFFDQNLDAIYNVNYGKLIQTGIWNSKGKYLPEYTSLEEHGRVITIPNWAIRYALSENHIIELENGLLECVEKGILNIDVCRIIMSFGIDYCRIA